MSIDNVYKIQRESIPKSVLQQPNSVSTKFLRMSSFNLYGRDFWPLICLTDRLALIFRTLSNLNVNIVANMILRTQISAIHPVNILYLKASKSDVGALQYVNSSSKSGAFHFEIQITNVRSKMTLIDADIGMISINARNPYNVNSDSLSDDVLNEVSNRISNCHK